jgi:hypothetical protein
MRLTLKVGLLGLLVFGLTSTGLQANFVLCPAAGGTCGPAEGTTDDADVIMGSSNDDDLLGFGGNDVIFAGPGDDSADGDEGGAVPGNDIIIGGPGSDDLNGLEGNDILMPGPDNGPNLLGQFVNGNAGNDTTNVFVSEISSCLHIQDFPEFGGTSGLDVVNLVGFGPYTAQKPFGQTGFGTTIIHVVDPITGGDIFIDVDEDSDEGIEVINGLLSPDVTFFNDELPDECVLE